MRALTHWLQGSISLSSVVDSGSRFVVRLPRQLAIRTPGKELMMATKAEPRQVTILMVEDDPGHARLIERNIRRAGVCNDIVHVSDGSSALASITTGLAGNSKPLLVLQDLNLPDMSGERILEHLKADEALRRVPVIVLTTTDDEREIERCYALGANVYITKPVDYGQFANAIRQLGLFLSVIHVPEIGA